MRVAVNYICEKTQLKKELESSKKNFYKSINNFLDCFDICKNVRDDSGKIIDFDIDSMNRVACYQKQLEQQRLVMEISQHVRESLNLPEILQTTVEEVRHLLQTD
ncbi:MAG: hypothetical protein RMX96_34620 [Nostoc sp. ChiSLP02]|nr:hypothetical protein [Nostoc sp. ChiSLP02]